MAATLLTPVILDVDLKLRQGTDAAITLTVVDGNSQPITNTTGYSIRAQIRAFAAATGAPLFEWNTTPGAGIGTAAFIYASGISTVTLTLTAAQSALFTFGPALWDCLFTSPVGQVICLAAGNVTIEPFITH
ncbi:MAG: hypothetical protein ACRDQX_13885 [Pseudonocardiaceae bacterium]